MGTFLRDDRTAGIDLLASLKQDIGPAMERTEKALRDGRPLLALHRLASVEAELAAAAYLAERSSAQRQQTAEFEKEWSRMGGVLRADLAPSPTAFEGVRPAAVRAVGEAALPKVAVLYESSLEYGRNTMPEAGLYYIGAALAQKQFAAFCRSLSAPTPQEATKPRSLEVELANRFGVTRYPAIFVDDVLVATPKDFGFYGKGEGAGDGRYTPLKSAASHERFRADLTRMIQLLIAGQKDAARAAATTPDRPELAAMPAFTLTDLEGREVERGDLRGRVVVVEFWATWCPPCRGTLGWRHDLKSRYGDRLAVLAVAIESEEADVGKVAQDLGSKVGFAMGTPAMARAFGDVTAVPTLFLFDGQGRTAAAYYGAPPGLHADAEGRIRSLVE